MHEVCNIDLHSALLGGLLFSVINSCLCVCVLKQKNARSVSSLEGDQIVRYLV